ncbi:type VI secretion system baseplate subunit TssE [Luteimonas huabeiensis]|uniref:type VI secretion system baseplate subunit TssE n=1 Tax=Luteimonas huabeiensis TaxID=1244513 RepID=UPI00046313C1|nr:type VI secretion system baseplate subunit TssE [Luteimonas huabeiensis]
MAELTPQERLQPSLLDRLADDEPGRGEESRDRRTITAARLRECVIRDLSWLLNCTHAEADRAFDDHPHAACSVLNFGIPDLAGLALSGIDPAQMERRLRAAILAFEPRLLPDTLQVRVRADGRRMDRKSLVFDIESEMWAQPLPLNLYLKTEVDLETGRLEVGERYG